MWNKILVFKKNLIRFGKKNTPSKKVPLTIAKIVPKGCLVVDFLNTICIWKEKGELVRHYKPTD